MECCSYITTNSRTTSCQYDGSIYTATAICDYSNTWRIPKHRERSSNYCLRRYLERCYHARHANSRRATRKRNRLVIGTDEFITYCSHVSAYLVSNTTNSQNSGTDHTSYSHGT